MIGSPVISIHVKYRMSVRMAIVRYLKQE